MENTSSASPWNNVQRFIFLQSFIWSWFRNIKEGNSRDKLDRVDISLPLEDCVTLFGHYLLKLRKHCPQLQTKMRLQCQWKVERGYISRSFIIIAVGKDTSYFFQIRKCNCSSCEFCLPIRTSSRRDFLPVQTIPRSYTQPSWWSLSLFQWSSYMANEHPKVVDHHML